MYLHGRSYSLRPTYVELCIYSVYYTQFNQIYSIPDSSMFKIIKKRKKKLSYTIPVIVFNVISNMPLSFEKILRSVLSCKPTTLCPTKLVYLLFHQKLFFISTYPSFWTFGNQNKVTFKSGNRR